MSIRNLRDAVLAVFTVLAVYLWATGTASVWLVILAVVMIVISCAARRKW